MIRNSEMLPNTPMGICISPQTDKSVSCIISIIMVRVKFRGRAQIRVKFRARTRLRILAQD